MKVVELWKELPFHVESEDKDAPVCYKRVRALIEKINC